MSNDDNNAARLATTLRQARKISGLSVRQLQAVSYVAKSVISRFEHEGNGSAHNLLALARALELRASDLFSQAGRAMPRPSPSLPAMLRAEYDLPPEAIKEIQHNIEQVARKYRANDFD
jgi:transcriptional regulator with XRE-family HTH domain